MKNSITLKVCDFQSMDGHAARHPASNARYEFTFKKLLLLFSAVIIPFFLLSLFLLLQNSAAIQSRTFSSLQEKSDLTAQTLTDAMDQLYHTATEIAEQENLKRVANTGFLLSPYETAKNVRQLQEQQTSIKNANPYIENFIIYYKESSKAYNSTGDGRPSFFEFTQEEYQGFANTYASSHFLTLHDQKLTEIIQPYSSSKFLFRIDLSEQTITALLEDAFPEYEPYYFLEAFDRSYQLTNLSDKQLAQLFQDEVPSSPVIEGEPYYYFSSSLSYGGMQIHFFFSKERLFADTRTYQYLNLLFGLFLIFACCFFLWGSYAIIHKPIQALINAFHDISDQNYHVRILSKKNSDFAYLYREFNLMAQKLQTLIEKDYQQQLLLNKAELKQLQAQINPHFLYNSFLLLRRMMQDELYEEAQKTSDTLGLYFKYITRNSQEYMPLRQEYQHAMLYCEIQQLRFEERIRIEMAPLPEEYSGLLVPKLIVQPILENAFNYGLRDKVADGLLRVTFSGGPGKLTLSIEDNGENLTDQQLEELQEKLAAAASGSSQMEMTGILNIQRRLAIYYNDSGFLRASRSSLGGLCVELVLPVCPPENEK